MSLVILKLRKGFQTKFKPRVRPREHGLKMKQKVLAKKPLVKNCELQETHIFNKAVHQTNIIEKIVWSKGHQCLCSQDTQRSERPRERLSPNNVYLRFYAILASDEFSHEYDIPSAALISVTKSGQDQIHSVSHSTKSTIKRSLSSRMNLICSTQINHVPQDCQTLLAKEIP